MNTLTTPTSAPAKKHKLATAPNHVHSFSAKLNALRSNIQQAVKKLKGTEGVTDMNLLGATIYYKLDGFECTMSFPHTYTQVQGYKFFRETMDAQIDMVADKKEAERAAVRRQDVLDVMQELGGKQSAARITMTLLEKEEELDWTVQTYKVKAILDGLVSEGVIRTGRALPFREYRLN